MFFRDSIAATQMVVKKENNYDASTDEESENPARASLPSGKTESIVFVLYHRQALCEKTLRKAEYYLTDCSVTSQPAGLKNTSPGAEYNTGIFKLERGGLKACCTSEGTVISGKVTNYTLCRTNDSLTVSEPSTIPF